MRQTVVDWGDLRFWNVQTNSIDQEQVFDPTGTEVLYSKITVSITGHIREGAATAGLRTSLVDYSEGDEPPTPTAASANLTSAVNQVRVRLSDRQIFRMWIGCDDSGDYGTLHLWVSPYVDDTEGGVYRSHTGGTEWLDANAGPKCTRFTIENNFAAYAMRVSATFELCVPWCVRSTDETRILMNRWSVADSIDENLVTTRTYNGVMKVANPYINPNLLRQAVLPPLAQGMRRHSMVFHVGDDGRSMNYTIVDKEAMFAAPEPAKTWNIIHSDSVGLGRATVNTSLSISLTGHRNVSKKDLLKLATRIAEEKITGLFLQNNADNNKVQIHDMTTVDYTSSDGPVRIELRMSCTRLREDGGGFMDAAGDFGKDLEGALFPAYVGAPDPYDANYTAEPGEEGPIQFAGAVVAYMKNICSGFDAYHIRDGAPPDPETSIPPVSDPSGMPSVSVREVPAGSITYPTWISTQFKDAIYTSYQVDSIWDNQDNRIQLPIAQSSAAYSAGQDTCAIVRLGLPMTTRTIRIEASRLGDAPNLQEPLDVWSTGSSGDGSLMTYTRLRTKVAPTVPQKSANGQDLWTVRAEYVYACSRPPRSNEALPIGIDPSFTGIARKLAAGSLSTFNENSTIS